MRRKARWMVDQEVPSELYDEAYYLGHCGGYEDFKTGALAPRLAKAWRIAPPRPGDTVLDIGCGRGEICREAARVGAEVVGIDYSEKGVEIARTTTETLPPELRSRITLCQADATALPFDDDLFDVIFMLDVVEHLYPKQLHMALKEAARVLKPNGKLVIHTAPNRLHKVTVIPLYRRWMAILTFPLANRVLGSDLSIVRTVRNPEDDELHVNEQTWWSLRRYARLAGLHGRVWCATYPLQRTPAEILFYITQYLWPLSSVSPFSLLLSNDVWAVLSRRKVAP